MGEEIENGTIYVGGIIGKTLDGKDIYKFTEVGTAENVEIREPQYKDGDFVVSKAGSILIFKEKVGNSIYDHAYLSELFGMVIFSNTPSIISIERHATEEEKQKMLDALAEEGKRWDEEEKCIEDIPTYKMGDFLVKEYKDGAQYIFILDYIDDGGLIYFHCYHADKYNSTYVADDFGIGRIGDACHKCLRYATDLEKELLIAELSIVGKRWNEKKKCIEDWLEPYTDELKEGDLVIFWDSLQKGARIGVYNEFRKDTPYPHVDHIGNVFKNAIKFESEVQYKRLLRGGL